MRLSLFLSVPAALLATQIAVDPLLKAAAQ